ncbi:uncharacterized protein LOC114803055 [Denticeps clupeoides]|uniref:uncharacterized protein LOC114803055 n=1 Tax=Denticeps clupeoides TaxID=299321 RepID=UPI0010A38E83|nr:RAD51-associated protein 2 [Denticeps clupeoides]XP_028858161.1 RAD51-associated protein 2 [Denticeps clupeoides]XP_028858162.1 RAD51-associated protein 2 [Denticeps clupeoides]XP_028858163.1 RAD51-associated protein 2 [Denticeps clupeoides]
MESGKFAPTSPKQMKLDTAEQHTFRSGFEPDSSKTHIISAEDEKLLPQCCISQEESVIEESFRKGERKYFTRENVSHREDDKVLHMMTVTGKGWKDPGQCKESLNNILPVKRALASWDEDGSHILEAVPVTSEGSNMECKPGLYGNHLENGAKCYQIHTDSESPTHNGAKNFQISDNRGSKPSYEIYVHPYAEMCNCGETVAEFGQDYMGDRGTEVMESIDALSINYNLTLRRDVFEINKAKVCVDVGLPGHSDTNPRQDPIDETVGTSEPLVKGEAYTDDTEEILTVSLYESVIKHQEGSSEIYHDHDASEMAEHCLGTQKEVCTRDANHCSLPCWNIRDPANHGSYACEAPQDSTEDRQIKNQDAVTDLQEVVGKTLINIVSTLKNTLKTTAETSVTPNIKAGFPDTNAKPLEWEATENSLTKAHIHSLFDYIVFDSFNKVELGIDTGNEKNLLLSCSPSKESPARDTLQPLPEMHFTPDDKEDIAATKGGSPLRCTTIPKCLLHITMDEDENYDIGCPQHQNTVSQDAFTKLALPTYELQENCDPVLNDIPMFEMKEKFNLVLEEQQRSACGQHVSCQKRSELGHINDVDSCSLLSEEMKDIRQIYSHSREAEDIRAPNIQKDSEQEVPLHESNFSPEEEDSMYSNTKDGEARKSEKTNQLWSPAFSNLPSPQQPSLEQARPSKRLEPLRTCTRPIRVGLSKKAKTKCLHPCLK